MTTQSAPVAFLLSLAVSSVVAAQQATPSTAGNPAQQPPESRQSSAQDPKVQAAGDQRLDPVIITATRSAASAMEAPYATATVGAAEIEERSMRSTPQALRYVPGVMVQET